MNGTNSFPSSVLFAKSAVHFPVAEVERRLSVVEELESVVSANLQRAFTGNLLTADDADNTDKK